MYKQHRPVELSSSELSVVTQLCLKMPGVGINRLQALELSKHRGLLNLIVCCVVALWVSFSDRALAQLRKKKSMGKDPVTLFQGTAMQAALSSMTALYMPSLNIKIRLLFKYNIQ